jgi:putative transposase
MSYAFLHTISVIAVAPHYTSQNCSACGIVVKKALSVRTHICHSCGVVLDRDQNATRNILHKALGCTVGHTETGGLAP